MKKITKMAVGVVAAVASVTLVTAPAMATPYNFEEITVGAFTWQTDDNYLAPDEIRFGTYVNSLDDQRFGITVNEFDDMAEAECFNADVADAADGSGDKIVTCDAYAATDAVGLTLQPALRIYASGQLARFSVDVTNSTSSPLGYQWQYFIDIGNSDLVWQSEGARGAQTIDMDLDNWATSEGKDSQGAAVSYAWGGPQGVDRAAGYNIDNFEQGYFFTTENYELVPDETVTFAFFNFVQTSAEADDLARIALWEATAALFGGPGGEITIGSVTATDPDYNTLFAGLAPGTVVANWATVPAVASTLPDTGVSENAGIWAASAALIAGLGVAGVFMARRRQA